MAEQPVLRLTERYCRCHPTDDSMPGPVEEPIELDPRSTAFVSLHCWNIGFPDGPAAPLDYWVFMGSLENHRLCVDVVNDAIVPALTAARRAGLSVFHVQPQNIAEKHAGWDYQLEPVAAKPARRPPVSDYARARAERVHGPGFRQWSGWDQADVARAAYPAAGEQMIVTADQFDRILRERGITTLVYVGFATNLCILDSPAAMKEMSQLGYRCLLIREGTLAVEFADTIHERLNTQVATRYIEAWVGSTIGLADFVRATAGIDLRESALASA
jgi:nicotinamidase-related amidase